MPVMHCSRAKEFLISARWLKMGLCCLRDSRWCKLLAL